MICEIHLDLPLDGGLLPRGKTLRSESKRLQEVVWPRSCGWWMSSDIRWRRLRNRFLEKVYVPVTRHMSQSWQGSNFDHYRCPLCFRTCRSMHMKVGKQSQLVEVFLFSSLELRTDNGPKYLCAFYCRSLGLIGSPCLWSPVVTWRVDSNLHGIMIVDSIPNVMHSSDGYSLIFSIGLSSQVVHRVFRNSRVFNAYIDGDELLDSSINVGSSGGKAVISNFSKLLYYPPKTWLHCGFTLGRFTILPFSRFIRWREEKERGHEENERQTLVL